MFVLGDRAVELPYMTASTNRGPPPDRGQYRGAETCQPDLAGGERMAQAFHAAYSEDVVPEPCFGS